jgi:hypothetical protein
MIPLDEPGNESVTRFSEARKINDNVAVTGVVDASGSKAFLWQSIGIVPAWDLFALNALPTFDGVGSSPTQGAALDFPVDPLDPQDPLSIVGWGWRQVEGGIPGVWRERAFRWQSTSPGALVELGPAEDPMDPWLSDYANAHAYGISPAAGTYTCGRSTDDGITSGCPTGGVTGDRLAGVLGRRDAARGLRVLQQRGQGRVGRAPVCG